jgi:hypothetical protein
MNGKGPHLGLVLTKGAVRGYSIENRSRANESSNIRGTIALNTESFSLKPGQSYTLQWKLFWHQGWKDFYTKAKNRFVHVKDKYVISKGEKIKIETDALKTVNIKQNNIVITGDKPGNTVRKLSLTMVRNILFSIIWSSLHQRKYLKNVPISL